MKTDKKQEIIDIALANPKGFTINKNTLKSITEGYAIAVKETQDSFDTDGLNKVLKIAEKSYIDAIGGWYNEKNQKYYFDAVMIVDDLGLALRLGFDNKQIAIYNITDGREIELK